MVLVKLADILDALEYPEDWECFLDRNTGKVIATTENEQPYLEDEEADLDELPEWQRQTVLEVRQALGSADLLPLPDKFDLHEWDIMRRFASAQEEPARTELLDAIHGAGAFRMFRRTTDRLGLRDAWFSYRDETIKEFARDWLQENGIAFVEE